MITGAPGYVYTLCRPVRSTVMPVSSNVSRTAASVTLSPDSTKPPGNVQSPGRGLIDRRGRKIAPAGSGSVAPTTFGRSMKTNRQREHTCCSRWSGGTGSREVGAPQSGQKRTVCGPRTPGAGSALTCPSLAPALVTGATRRLADVHTADAACLDTRRDQVLQPGRRLEDVSPSREVPYASLGRRRHHARRRPRRHRRPRPNALGRVQDRRARAPHG